MDSIMQTESITVRTKRMIDDLKTICANFGLGGSPGEYKIITQVFLYKYLSDKFIYEAQKAEPSLAGAGNVESALTAMPDDQYEMLLLMLGGSTAKLKKTHYISYLFNHQNDNTMRKADGSTYLFHEMFDDTLVDIANFNLDIFSVQTGGEEKIKLFEPISQYIIESAKKPLFCRALINKLVEFNFAEVFEQKYDFFAQIFEHLIKDYNKDSGKYAEYYTPHTIATIIARIMVQGNISNVIVYDPAAGSGTLVLALAHQIGEENCTIFTQDISAKSNEFLRLNLILNNLVHSLGNVVHDDTLIAPRHLNAQRNGLAKFNYIVSNPPFNMDFSDNRETLAGRNHKERFFAGVPNIPNKDKNSMAIYLMFLQHIIYSMDDSAKAAVVVPTGFLTAGSGIQKKIREYIVGHRMLRGVVSMPSNVFANTGTNVSVLFLDKENKDGKVILMDASKLGTKEKVDGKNQKTVLSEDDMALIVDTFNAGKTVDDFCVVVSYEDIEQKKLSFSAGQYFEVKIEYVELTPEEFNQKMNGFAMRLNGLFLAGHQLENEIKEQLERIKYE
jgi:type I restriction enzyme M protein